MQAAALYIRVSTDDQTEYSPDAQKRLLIDYAKKNNLVISNEYIFIEEGLSGTKADKRPQFQRMIGLAKSKEHPIDVILVWKFSRFARNQEESIVYKSLLKKNNVDVISVSEPVVDGPFGSLIERIIEWMDEYYSIRLAEEVKRGMTEKALRGQYQTYAPFGYSIEKGILYPDEDKAKIVRYIYESYLHKGEGCFAIAKSLNEMGIKTIRGNQFENRTVKYILQNPVYKGFVRWNPTGKKDLRMQKNITDDLIIEKGEHEPIISEDIWDAVKAKMLKEYRPRYSKPSTVLSHWLGGVLICDNCNNVLVSGGSSGGFQCNSYAKGKCRVSHYVSHGKIEDVVITSLKEIIISGKFTYEIIKHDSEQSNRELIKDGIKRLIDKENRIKDAYMNGIDTLDEYKENKDKIVKERIDLEEQLKKISIPKKTKDTKNAVIDRLKSVVSIITSDADTAAKNKAIKSVVKKIVYSKKAEHIDVYLYYS